jgi:Zn-finger nucleic acid-binding protein
LRIAAAAPTCTATNRKERPMLCPMDGTRLLMTERSGVEIDYCPQCRGVWLDRGELDKIIAQAAGPAPAAASLAAAPAPVELREPRPERRASPERQVYRYDDDDDDDDHHHRRGRPYRKRRESFLSDLFDF